MVKEYYLGCTCRYLKPPLKECILDLNPPPHILCATPGRLYDLHCRNVISFKDVKLFVVDEAGNAPVHAIRISIKKIY